MLYTIVFVEKQKLRDDQLDRILSDKEDGGVFYSGTYNWMCRINTGGKYSQLWPNDWRFGKKGLKSCSKWKTIRGAQNVLKTLSKNTKFSVNGDSSLWNKDLFVPVIYDISEIWNKRITNEIAKEILSHNKRLEILKKQLCIK